MTDKEIIEIFSDKRGKINSNKTKTTYLDKHPELKEYLENRFEEFIGYTETLQYIFNGFIELHRCRTCGGILISCTAKYCSTQCELTNLDFIKDRNKKIDYKARTVKFKQTCQDRYGVDVPAQNSEIKQKMIIGHDFKTSAQKCKETCLNKYGVENVFQLPEIKEKATKTKLENRPNDPNNSEKAMQTMEERYGHRGTMANAELREKAQATHLAKYGRKSFGNQEKYNKIMIDRYGENPTQFGSNGFKQNIQDKYGVEFYCQSEEYLKNRKRKFCVDNIGFDSLLEVAFYTYNRDLGNKIEHEPCRFEYTFEGKKHICTPDFKVNGQLYEIKGAHFFSNGQMINPFDRSQDALYEAKHQCMLSNSVIFITDCREYIEYLKSNYNIDEFLTK